MDDFLCCGDVGNACSVSARHPKSKVLGEEPHVPSEFLGRRVTWSRSGFAYQAAGTRASHMSATLWGAMESQRLVPRMNAGRRWRQFLQEQYRRNVGCWTIWPRPQPPKKGGQDHERTLVEGRCQAEAHLALRTRTTSRWIVFTMGRNCPACRWPHLDSDWPECSQTWSFTSGDTLGFGR